MPYIGKGIYNQYLMFYIPDGNTYVEKLSSEITNKLKKYIPSNDNIPIAVYADHLESADGFDMTGNYDPETEEFTIDDEYRSNRFFNFWLYEYNLGQYDQCFRNITLSPTALTCETNWKYETNGWVEIPFESLILIPVNWMGLIPLFVE